MKYSLILLLAIFFIGNCVWAQKKKELAPPKSERVISTNLNMVNVTDFIKIPVPEDFSRMNDDQLAAKYPSGRKPLAMFTSVDLLVNFGVNATNTAWEEKDLVILKDFQKANIRTLYENALFSRDEIVKIGKKEFAIFEFVGDASSAEGRTAKFKTFYCLMYCIIRKQVYVINFNCPNTERMAWQNQVKKMVSGVRVTR